MPKLRKQRRRKVYRHNVNRKRIRNKQFSEGNIACKEIKNAWDSKKSLQSNLKDMGLCYDPNETIRLGPKKEQKIAKIKKTLEDEWDIHDVDAAPKLSQEPPPKKYVIDALISDAKAPRVKMLRLPKGHIEHLTYMLTTYGLDYKAMTRDKRNYNQETWRQLRARIKRFQCIPEQYNIFLENATAETMKKLANATLMDEDD